MGMKGHNGYDFDAWHGERVFHAGTYDGWMKIEKDFQGGIGVDIISNEPLELSDHKYIGYVKTRYWHLKAPIGHDGKQIKFGETIGLADNTGSSSGDHLHFGLKPCDKDGKSNDKANGYFGAVNPTRYFNLSVDAETAAKTLMTPPPMLSSQERKEMESQLSTLRRAVLALREAWVRRQR